MGNEFALGIGIYDPAYRASSLPYDLSIAVGCSLIHHLSHGSVEPLEIFLMRHEPEDPWPYRKLAGCPVRFNQAQSCIVLSTQQLAYKIPSADPVARAALLKILHERLSQASWGFSEQVRHALRPSLLLGKVSLPEIARGLGLHHRMLERHLRLEGTSFEAIKEQVRFALAKDLLSLTSLHIGEISVSLGYGSHSSFVHAFQRWTGISPTKWRADCPP
jgi:AraC-like DNA-binding protein